MKVAELDFSKVDNKTKLETMLQEEAAIRQENKERELERQAETAEKAKEKVEAPVNHFSQHISLLLTFFMTRTWFTCQIQTSASFGQREESLYRKRATHALSDVSSANIQGHSTV